jgi:F-type H+-transporting ATPase subunit alpha
MEEQVVQIWSGTTGKLDDVPVEDVLRFEQEFLDYLKTHSKILDTIRETEKLEDDTEKALEDQLAEFRKTFKTTDGNHLGADEAIPVTDKDINQAQIATKKRG